MAEMLQRCRKLLASLLDSGEVRTKIPSEVAGRRQQVAQWVAVGEVDGR